MTEKVWGDGTVEFSTGNTLACAHSDLAITRTTLPTTAPTAKDSFDVIFNHEPYVGHLMYLYRDGDGNPGG